MRLNIGRTCAAAEDHPIHNIDMAINSRAVFAAGVLMIALCPSPSLAQCNWPLQYSSTSSAVAHCCSNMNLNLPKLYDFTYRSPDADRYSVDVGFDPLCTTNPMASVNVFAGATSATQTLYSRVTGGPSGTVSLFNTP